MTGSASRISLPDGRALGYLRLGDPAGLPVIYAHGFPASRLEAELWREAASRVGVLLIAADRPGLGLSDFQPGRTILHWTHDVASLADRLGIEKFRLLGVSGGCPYALACAYRLHRRIPRAAMAAGLGPTGLARGTCR